MTRIRAGLLFSTAIFLGGCAIQPIQQDQPLSLQKGYGLVAVQLVTDEAQSQILFDSVDGKRPQLAILNVPAGNNLYVLKAPAGDYCMSEYFYVGQRIFPHDTGCFSVSDGHLGFSGYLSPQVVDGQIFVEQAFREDDAEAQLKQKYPAIAAQYLRAAAPNMLFTTWVERNQGHTSRIYFHNSMDTLATIRTLELEDCKNVKQECKLYDLNVSMAPHETKAVMEVEAADHTAAFSYTYEYNKP